MEENNKKEIIQVPIEDILPNRFQPRLTFDEKELQELSNSILRYGVIQPIVLRKLGDKYEIVAGERRYKASTMAGLNKIPAIIIDTDDNTSAEIALLENLQRKNLTVIEEAQSYKKLIDRGFTQEDIALKLGVSQSAVANKIRLLNLPREVQDALLYNRISERHARCLLTLQNEDMQKSMLGKIINERLTVKQTEEEINIINNKDKIMNEELPADIQRFLNPEPRKIEAEKQSIDEIVNENNNDLHDLEVLEFKIPEVIDIEESSGSAPEEVLPSDKPNFEVNNLDVPAADNAQEAVTEKIDSENIILNPFQDESFKDLIDKLDSTREQFNYSDLTSDNTELDNTEGSSIASSPEPVKEASKEFNLPRVINKVRSFVRELDEDSDSEVTTEEVDLPDSYQIIINIKK